MFFPHRKSECIVFEIPATFLLFGCLCLGMLDFKSERYFYTLEVCVFNLLPATSAVCLCSLLASFKKSCSATTNFLGKKCRVVLKKARVYADMCVVLKILSLCGKIRNFEPLREKQKSIRDLKY